MKKRNAKITKRSHAYKGITCMVHIIFILQLKETESAVRSKLIIFLSELRGFQFVTALFIKPKK